MFEYREGSASIACFRSSRFDWAGNLTSKIVDFVTKTFVEQEKDVVEDTIQQNQVIVPRERYN